MAENVHNWETLAERVNGQLPEIEGKLASRLPVIPQIVQTFSTLTSDPDVSINTVADAISKDGTLTSMLLKFESVVIFRYRGYHFLSMRELLRL